MQTANETLKAYLIAYRSRKTPFFKLGLTNIGGGRRSLAKTKRVRSKGRKAAPRPKHLTFTSSELLRVVPPSREATVDR